MLCVCGHNRTMTPTPTYDVLVVGGGPAGARAGYELARLGHAVIIAERKVFPRDKTCGDVVSPRAVRSLQDMGLAAQLETAHRSRGVRTVAHGRTIEVPWPTHPHLPDFGYVIKRHALDHLVLDHAAAAGTVVRSGHEAMSPLVERGFVRGAVLRNVSTDATESIRARYVIVADGANSRFGRSLGTTRAKTWPHATAIRGYWASPKHAVHWVESTFDLRDRNGKPLPGYGWVFPLGDGTVNVGVGLLSTARDFKSINTTQLLTEFAAAATQRWELSEDPVTELRGARLPMGGSVGPRSGPTYLVVGDAAGAVNPFNGEGIAYALETGLMAAHALHDALAGNDPRALTAYGRQFDHAYGSYFKVGRLFTRVVSHPLLMREASRVAIHSKTLMEWLLRIMSNTLRPDEVGFAEASYKILVQLNRLFPDA